MNKIQIKNILLYLVLLTIPTVICYSLRSNHRPSLTPSHKYWFNKDHPIMQKNQDNKWFYCDYKCLTLQKLNNNKDFVVITFNPALKQKFSACYVKTGTTYTLWSKVVQNTFFQKNCGEDYKDWADDGSFPIEGIYGVGIGTNLTQNDLNKMYVKPTQLFPSVV